MKSTRVLLPAAALLLLSACAGGGSGTTPTSDPTGSGTSSASGGPTSSASATSGVPTTTDSSRSSVTSSAGVPGEPSSAESSRYAEDLTLLPSKGSIAAPLTLTGVPTAGVESGCWLLDGYLLVGIPAGLVGTGQSITVTGRVQPDLMTTCQQGIPLRVESAVAS